MMHSAAQLPIAPRPQRRAIATPILAAAITLVLLAFALRLARLDARPLHFDEGNNVTFAQLTPASILLVSQQTNDTNPPGHRLTLAAWLPLAGPSPFSIRLLSALFGTLAVAILFHLLSTLRLPPAAALFATALLALSPFAIDYAQQAKGYTLGLAMALASWCAWLALARPPRPPTYRLAWAFAYIATTALMLTTHYYTLPNLLMQWLWWFATRRAPPPSFRRAAPLALLQGLASLPLAAWTLLAANTAIVGAVTAPGGLLPLPLPAFLNRTLGELAVSQFASPALTTAAAVLLAASTIAGAVALWRSPAHSPPAHNAPRQAFWFGAAATIPLAFAFLVQFRVPFFYPRFLLYALPSACTLIAGCLLNTRLRAATALAAATLCATGAASLYSAPIDTAYDLRPIAAAIRPLVKPGDAFLAAYIWMPGLITSYLPETQSRLTWYADVYSPDTINDLMAPIAQRHDRVWVLGFQRDPASPSASSILWLKQHGASAAQFDAGQMNLLLFASLRNQPAAALMSSAPISSAPISSAIFDQRVQLDFAPLSRPASLGDVVAITLKWTALHPLAEPLSIFVHLIAPDGRIVAQSDGDAVNGLAPNFTWPIGQPITDRRALLISQPLPPGQYELCAGLYRRHNGQRLTTQSGADKARIGIIQSAPTQP